MNIPDEAWDAFQKAYHTYRHTRSPDPGDEGCFDSNARKHALNAAIPYIMEGLAREAERSDCDIIVRYGHEQGQGPLCDWLRSLAPMEKTPTP